MTEAQILIMFTHVASDGRSIDCINVLSSEVLTDSLPQPLIPSNLSAAATQTRAILDLLPKGVGVPCKRACIATGPPTLRQETLSLKSPSKNYPSPFHSSPHFQIPFTPYTPSPTPHAAFTRLYEPGDICHVRIYLYIFLWAQVNLTVAIWAPVKVDLQRAAIEKKIQQQCQGLQDGKARSMMLPMVLNFSSPMAN